MLMQKYYSLTSYCKDIFGKKLYKLCLDGGFTCPNRDGRVGTGGCIFCDADGSGRFTGRRIDGVIEHGGGCLSITEQLEREKKLVAGKLPKTGEVGYIAYFQAFTSTYDNAERLRGLYLEAISGPDVCVLSIATRPDCLGEDVLEVIKEISQKITVWVELGLQTSNEETAKLINRCYKNDVYEESLKKLRRVGVSHIITHVIVGLPGETVDDIQNTVSYVVNKCYECGVDKDSYNCSYGIKLQLLHVLEGTKLAEIYARGEFEVLSLEEYTDVLRSLLDIIPKEMVIHRLTGDGDKRKLIAPLWSGDKKRVMNYINNNLKYL